MGREAGEVCGLREGGCPFFGFEMIFESGQGPMRDNKPLLWALVGAVVLAALRRGWPLSNPSRSSGGSMRPYGGNYIALSLAWGGSSWMAFGPTATIYSVP